MITYPKNLITHPITSSTESHPGIEWLANYNCLDMHVAERSKKVVDILINVQITLQKNQLSSVTAKFCV